MSEDIFEVSTSFADVAELGQGYVDRADGERILLALPRPAQEGEAVRFIIHLADGTPAFAGAGRCAQVSDQGDEAAPQERFETLLDSLAFDERSRPVYDYIVAVRQMTYAAGEDASAATEVGEEAVYENEASSTSGWPEAAAEVAKADSVSPAVEATTVNVEFAQRTPQTDPSPPLSEPPLPTEDYTHVFRSVMPEPLPTGILQRPAIAAHWQPSAPRPPRPSSRPSRFRYPAGALPMPSSPPRPDLDRSQWVEPAATA